ncbi:hypothetical protein SteCoe_14657 [Stentor coeruleus]|uniref:Uncharacterized protein n=1 Tax=Stentor coeruleus TaxID=5963 RepID=A0A1R2C5D7_9CILI|nr:hypothetical protein SteCoe_14657 [Stentor coeruleus]
MEKSQEPVYNVLQIEYIKKTTKIVRTIKSLKIFTLLSFLAIIASNVIILVEVSKEVQHSYYLENVVFLGKVNYCLSYIGFLARSLHLSKVFNQELPFQPEDLSYYSSQLPELHDFLLKGTDWSYWKSSFVVEKNVLPVYQSLLNPKIEWNNLADLLSDTYINVISSQVNRFLNNISNETLFPLIYNSLHISMNYLQNSFTSLILSEKARLSSLSTNFYYFFLVGVCLIAIFGLLSFIVICPLHKYLSEIWNELYKTTVLHSFAIRTKVNNRVEKFFHIDEYFMLDDLDIVKKTHFSHLWHYTARLFILVGLGLGLYFISMFVFYSSIEEYMKSKIDLADAMNVRRARISQRTMFAIEIFADYNGYGFGDMYGANIFPDSETSFNQLIIIIANSRRNLFKFSTQKILTNSVWTETYDIIPSENETLHYGIISGTFEMKIEAQYLSKVYKNCNFTCFQKIYKESKILMTYFISSLQRVDSSPNYYIVSMFKSLVIFTILSLFILLLLVVCYIFPYLSNEQKMVQHIQKILTEILIDRRTFNTRFSSARFSEENLLMIEELHVFQK